MENKISNNDNQIRPKKIRPFTPELLTRKGIIYAGMKQFELLNTFREIRARLIEKTGRTNMIILVSSVNTPKSSEFLSVNLAASFSLDSQKTSLVVDCNPYNPISNDFLGHQSEHGLTEYLSSDGIGIPDLISYTGIDRLRVISSGDNSHSAAELYSSQKMSDLISELKTRYSDRAIVINSPPVELHSEARILSQHIDIALLSVPYGKVTKPQVLSATEALGKDNFAGVIFQY